MGLMTGSDLPLPAWAFETLDDHHNRGWLQPPHPSHLLYPYSLCSLCSTSCRSAGYMHALCLFTEVYGTSLNCYLSSHRCYTLPIWYFLGGHVKR